MFKRSLTYIFFLCTLLMSLTVIAAAEQVSYPVTGGNIYFDTETGAIVSSDMSVTEAVIPAEINGIPVTSIGNSAFFIRQKLAKVVLPDSITSIGNSAFHFCSGLTSIALPNSVTTIGNSAFASCRGLTSIVLPGNLTSIGDYVFDWCVNLESVDFPDKLVSIGNNAFGYCRSLTAIDLPQGVTSIGDSAFYWCVNLESIALPDSLTSLGNRSFSACNQLTSVSLPKNLLSIGDQAFYSCDKLSAIELPDGIRSIGREAFSMCPALTDIDLPGSVTDIGDGVFSMCQNLSTISVDPSNTAYCVVDGVLYTKDMTSLLCCPARKPGYAYVRDFYVPDTVTKILDGAFSDCSYYYVYLSNNLVSIGDYAFCHSQLISIELPETLTGIGDGAFSQCINLNAIHIPAGVTYLGVEVFVSDFSLFSITVDPANLNFCAVDGVLYTGDMTRLLAYPLAKSDAVFVVPDAVTEIAASAFFASPYLAQVTLPDGLVSIEGGAFSFCKKLTGIIIPVSVKTLEPFIFSGSENFTDIYYCGSKEQWDQIDFVINSNSFDNITIHYDYHVDFPAPILETANDAATGKIVLSWNAIPGAEKYQIYRADSEDGAYKRIGAVTGTSATNSAAVAGKTYYYKVRAVSGDMTGEFSLAVSRTCALPRPTVKTSNDPAHGSVVLSWDAVPNAYKYDIYYSKTGKNGNYTYVTTTSELTYTLIGSYPTQTYYYRVVATHANSSAADSAASLPVGRTCDLARPVVTVTNNAATGKPVLRWISVLEADKYQIYVSSSKNGAYKLLGTVTGTSATHNSAVAGKTYYYRVKAICSDNSSANSAASPAVGKTCDLASPVVTVTLNSSGKPVISWDAVPGAVRYELYRSTNPDADYKRLWSGVLTEVTNNTVVDGTTYYYRVKAIAANSAANSAASIAKCIMVHL